MPDAVKDLTRAFVSVLRGMRLAADGGKARFGDWVWKVADKIAPTIARVHAGALRGFRGTVDKDDSAAVARQRAVETARSVCNTTAEWILQGYDDDRIFGDARAARCAVTEASWAINAAKAQAVSQRGQMLRWRLGGKACDQCKRLNGKTVKPGKRFGTDRDGNDVLGPPLHPSCQCKLVGVPR